jgi:hypothetical protein
VVEKKGFEGSRGQGVKKKGFEDSRVQGVKKKRFEDSRDQGVKGSEEVWAKMQDMGAIDK